MIFLDTILAAYYWLKIQDYVAQSDSGNSVYAGHL